MWELIIKVSDSEIQLKIDLFPPYNYPDSGMCYKVMS